ncbi:hypothetical protein ACI3ET_06230 [Ornithinimicrobium sp. LYQ121]|uniref:hypothetical protein n=1 Tax=Ornithinimicrobium sp. LYQ121 TaxID=3378801 RepID=UPI003851EB1E
MELSTRAQNAFVVGLAALAVGTSALAVWTVNRPHPSLSDLSPEPRAAPATAQGGSDEPVTSGPDTRTATEDATATSTAEPSESADEATDEPPARNPPSVEGWVEAWADEADVLVIGDGYSNMPTQWVQLWGRDQGQIRPVEIHHWGESRDVTFNDPIPLSDMEGARLTIWSAGRAGSTIAAAAQRVDRFVEEAAALEAVLVSLGLSSANEDVAASLDRLIDEIDEDLPVLIAVGPSGLYQPGVGNAMLEWAEDNDDRVSVVDLRDVAPENPTAEQWARAFQQAISEG